MGLVPGTFTKHTRQLPRAECMADVSTHPYRSYIKLQKLKLAGSLHLRQRHERACLQLLHLLSDSNLQSARTQTKEWSDPHSDSCNAAWPKPQELGGAPSAQHGSSLSGKRRPRLPATLALTPVSPAQPGQAPAPWPCQTGSDSRQGHAEQAAASPAQTRRSRGAR